MDKTVTPKELPESVERELNGTLLFCQRGEECTGTRTCPSCQSTLDELRAAIQAFGESEYQRGLREHRCTLPDSINEALNSGDGVYRP